MNNHNQPNKNQQWTWGALDPLTKTVVAAFSGRVGDGEGDLPASDFVDTMAEALPLTSQESIAKSLGYFGIQGIQRTIINQLGGLSHKEIADMTTHLGELAGEPHKEVADLTGQVLKMPDYRVYEAMPALTELSELAMRNLDTAPPQSK